MRKIVLSSAIAAALALPVLGSAQSVTVHSDGTSGDYPTIAAALAAVEADPSGPDVITLLDVGPHTTDAAIIISGDGNLNPVTLQGDDSLPERPIILLTSSGTGDASAGLFVNIHGTSTLRNLTLLLSNTSGRGGSILRYNPGATTTEPLDITMDNVLISANNGSDRPFTEDDGNTLSTAVPESLGDMQGPTARGIWLGTTNTSVVHNVSITNTIVSGIPGYTGLRIDMSGAPGTDIHIGQGYTASYLLGANVTAAGIDVRGHQPSNVIRIQGTAQNPIRIFNNPQANVAGLKIWPSANQTNATKTIEHVILANNGQGGIWVRQLAPITSNDNLIIRNSTIVDNDGPAIHILDNSADNWFDGTITAENLIMAGNGTSDPSNVFEMILGTPPGQAIFNDSAVVLAGPYSLTGDGFSPASPTNVTLNNVINGDPEFLSSDPSSHNYFRAGSVTYNNAGITGAYDAIPSSVVNWHLMK